MGIQTVSNPAADSVSEKDLLSSALDYALMPIKAFTKSTDYVNVQDAGIASLLHLGVGFGFGEAYGHKREREGKKSFIPVFRG